jgi:hypothetical protein
LDDQSDDESEEAEIITPTKEELISVAAHVGFQIEDLIHAEEEIVVAKVLSVHSPSTAKCQHPFTSKIINAIVRDRSLQHQRKPWKGALPKPRIYPPKTLGDAVIKNSFTRLRGGQLISRSFKMALPSMIQNPTGNELISSSILRKDEWPPLQSSSASQAGTEIYS